MWKVVDLAACKVAVVMAAPQQMEREAPSLAQMINGATSIKFGPHPKTADGYTDSPNTQIPGDGTVNFLGNPARGFQGFTPVTDQEGKSIATLKYSTNNYSAGQLSAQIVLPDGSIWAQIERAKSTKSPGGQHDPMTITINGALYATIDASGQNGRKGSLQRADGSGGLTFAYPCCQPAMKYLAVSVCLFIPTCGISMCLTMCLNDRISGKLDFPSVDGAPAPSLKITEPTLPGLTTATVDFAKYAGLDERAKLDLVLMVACHVCGQHTEPQSGGTSAGPGV